MLLPATGSPALEIGQEPTLPTSLLPRLSDILFFRFPTDAPHTHRNAAWHTAVAVPTVAAPGAEAADVSQLSVILKVVSPGCLANPCGWKSVEVRACALLPEQQNLDLPACTAPAPEELLVLRWGLFLWPERGRSTMVVASAAIPAAGAGHNRAAQKPCLG